jgi:hypothetical protein
MKVKELIELLQQCDEDLEVYAFTDHGQWMERVMSPSVVYFDPREADTYFTDEEEALENGYRQKAILL